MQAGRLAGWQAERAADFSVELHSLLWHKELYPTIGTDAIQHCRR